ncbi:uncharacterized protein LOC116937368 isoform X2 [Petromyzon marinus]|uniref:uncharacterized protein LOC116937368 isoform X2 n=1 Tax=Petromyzon marinus TaxID=7757 RepID=UPI003F6F20BD
MAMRQLVSRLGLLFLLLLHLVTWCSSHAPASPLNVRVESRDLLTQLRWEPADVNPATSSVTYRVESKLYGRAHWRTVCAATTETWCDVSSALRHPGDRYQLRVRATVSSSSPGASPISLPWVVVEVLPLETTVLSAPTVTVTLHKRLTVQEEEEAGGDEEEECRVEDEDTEDDDDDYDDDYADDYDDDDDDDDVADDADRVNTHHGDDDDDHHHGDDDDDDDDDGVDRVNTHHGVDEHDEDDHEDEEEEEEEEEWWELSVAVSMTSGWRRRMARSDVVHHQQAEVFTRGGTTITERFVGCRFRHAVPPPRGATEYCVRVRIVADYPRWKTGEWSPPSCVSVPPPHSVVAAAPISMLATGDAVSEGDTAMLRCTASDNPDLDPIQWSNPHGHTLYFQSVKAHTDPRVSLLHWSSTRLDLAISRVSTLDQGVYSCSLFSLGTPTANALLTVSINTTNTTTTPTTTPTHHQHHHHSYHHPPHHHHPHHLLHHPHHPHHHHPHHPHHPHHHHLLLLHALDVDADGDADGGGAVSGALPAGHRVGHLERRRQASRRRRRPEPGPREAADE